MIKKFSLLILFSLSFFYNLAFSDELSWTESSKSISSLTNTINSPQIVTHKSGQYVYIIWQTGTCILHSVQFAKSNDYGSSFSSTTLSSANLDAKDPQITTNSVTGQYVYGIWSKFNGTYYVIQFIRSTNYGSSFSSTINLSTADQNSYLPRVITDKTGRYVIAVWQKFNGTNYIIQEVHSTDYGKTFSNPSTLSQSGASYPKITNSNDGQYIYSAWHTSAGSNTFLVKFSKSTDYGETFSDPVTVSSSNFNGLFPKIKTSYSGQYIAVIWQKNNNSNHSIQASISADYGETFSDPIDLSSGTSNSTFPKCKMSSSGQYIYVCWNKRKGSKNLVQFTRSTNYGSSFSVPTNLYTTSYIHTFPHIATDLTGKYVTLTWQSCPSIYCIAHSSSSSNNGANFTSPQALSTTHYNFQKVKVIMNETGSHTYGLWKSLNNQSSTLKMKKRLIQ